MSLAEFADAVEAWNEVHGDGASLSDREANELSDWLNSFPTIGTA